MTLIVALKGADGLVLAGDSRGTYGDPRGVTAQNDSMIKLYQLTRYAGVLTAGNAGAGNELLAKWPGDRAATLSVTALLDTFYPYVRDKYNEWFSGFAVTEVPGMPIPVRPGLAFLIAGYDCDQAGNCTTPSLYALHSAMNFAPSRLDHGFVIEGVAQYGLYLLNRLYRDDQTVDQLKNLAAYLITETASQDGKVGGPVQMATITPQDGYHCNCRGTD